MNFYSLQNIITVNDDLVAQDAALDYEVASGVQGHPAVCRMTAYDPAGDLKETAVQGVAFEFAWSINNADPFALFTGKIASAKPLAHDRMEIIAFNEYNLALTRRLTMTLTDQSPTQMLKTLVGESLGIPTGRIAEVETELDKLPLFKMTVHEAIQAINRRMRLSYDSFVDEDGVFVWAPRDYEQESALDLEYGVDITDIDFERNLLWTWAQQIRLHQVITCTDHEDAIRTLFVLGLRYVQDTGCSIIEVQFEEIP